MDPCDWAIGGKESRRIIKDAIAMRAAWDYTDPNSEQNKPTPTSVSIITKHQQHLIIKKLAASLQKRRYEAGEALMGKDSGIGDLIYDLIIDKGAVAQVEALPIEWQRRINALSFDGVTFNMSQMRPWPPNEGPYVRAGRITIGQLNAQCTYSELQVNWHRAKNEFDSFTCTVNSYFVAQGRFCWAALNTVSPYLADLCEGSLKRVKPPKRFKQIAELPEELQFLLMKTRILT